MSIGDDIHILRRQENLTQEELAVKSGLSTVMISHIENGNRVPSIGSLQKIASALGKKLDISFVSRDEITKDDLKGIFG